MTAPPIPPPSALPPTATPGPLPSAVPATDAVIPPAPSVGDLAAKVAAPVCANDPGSWCQRFYDWTDNDFLAQSADAIVAKGSAILVTVLLALLARYLLHRAISRLVEGAASSRVPGIFRRRARPQVGETAPGAAAAPVSPRRAQRARTIGSVLRSASSFVVGAIAVATILGEFGVALAPVLASAGIAGLAIGFGAQNLVRDFLSGMFMLLEDQYGVGDIVDLGAANGTVEAVGLRITTVRDGNGTVWYVRNGEILRVGNKSQGYAVAIADLPLGHSADIAQAAEIAARVATEVADDPGVAEHLLEQPEVVGIEKVGPEGVTFRVQARTTPGQQFGVQRALITALAEAFDRAGLPRPLSFPTAPPPATK